MAVSVGTANALNNLAAHYYHQNEFERAEQVALLALAFAPNYRNALGIVNASKKKLEHHNAEKSPLAPAKNR